MTTDSFRHWWRRVRLGVPTVMGLKRLGHFLPDRNARSVVYPMAYPAVERCFDAAAPRFAEVLAAASRYADALSAIGGDPPPAPRWNQGWFPTLDAAVAYMLVRMRRPANIIEIGSGHSTRFLARAVSDGGFVTHHVAIDPRPRARLGGLSLTHHAATVQTVDLAVFDDLGPGDVLFIDSSHFCVAGSDVDLLINRVVPQLPAGVLIHIHDIYLPDDYPTHWRWRNYNEQSLMVPMLIGGGYVPLFASHYVATRMAEAVAKSIIGVLPTDDRAAPGSLWLEKRVDPATLAASSARPAGAA